MASRLLAAALVVTGGAPLLPVPLQPSPALSVELSDEQSLVVDAWAVVSRSYVDPGFGGADWKSVRGDFVKRKYRSMRDARAATTEMLALLGDRYTRYVSPAEYRALLARFEAPEDQGGVGVSLGSGSTGVSILAIERDTPAAAAGLRVGEVIVGVDGESFGTAAAPADVAASLLGPIESSVRVRVEAPLGEAQQQRTLQLRRAALTSGAATAELRTVRLPKHLSNISPAIKGGGGAVEGGDAGGDAGGDEGGDGGASVALGIIRVRQFSAGVTLPSLTAAISSAALKPAQATHTHLKPPYPPPATPLPTPYLLPPYPPTYPLPTPLPTPLPAPYLTPPPLQALLLDLRGNPGGHFPSAVDAARLFLPDDTLIVSVQRRESTEPIRTLESGREKRPLYLLVDQGSASASEVFAGALRDNKRATLVGEDTFGKGLVQTIAKTSDGGAVVCTVAKYRTPSGDDINGRGIAVDVHLACPLDRDAAACLSGP